MRRSSVLVAVGALLATLIPVASVTDAAFAGTAMTADFESPTVNVGDVVTTQYPFVTFDAVHLSGYGFTIGSAPANGTVRQGGYSNPTVVPSLGHNNTNAGQAPNCAEFCANPGVFGVLNNTADSISVYAGDSVSSNVPVELDAYDASRNLLGSVSANTASVGANTLLTFTPSSGTIAYFTVYLAITSDHAFEMDDLSIDVPPGSAPTVGVSAGTSGYELGQDGTISIPLTIQRLNGATGAVSLNVSGFTTDVTGSASDPGTGNTSTLIVSASHTAPLTGVPLTLSATSSGAQSEPPITVTVTVLPPISFAAPTTLVTQTCEPDTFTVDAQVAPGEPGSQVSFSTGFAPPTTGLSAQASTPVTISGGVADTTIQLSNTGSGGATDLVVTAALANGDSASVPIVLQRFGPSISAIDAIDLGAYGTPYAGTMAMTPRAGKPGTTIEVYGHGFCDNATVSVGNALATVNVPVSHYASGQGPYDYIRFTTPRLATTGPVTVSAGSPAAIGSPSPTSLTVDSYRNVNAWNFQNFDPKLTFDDLTQAFGADQTYLHVDVCSFVTIGLSHCPVSIMPDPLAEIWLEIAQDNMATGTCFGMALSTQRILAGLVKLSSLPGSASTIFGVPAPDTSPAAQLVHGQQPVMDLLKSVHLMQLSTEFMTNWALHEAYLNGLSSGSVSGAIAGEIQAIFAKGRFPLIEIQDQGGHVLVAYDIAQTGPGAYDIYVYDSNEQFTSDENASDGSTHSTRLGNSVIHLAADASWSVSSTTHGDGSAWHGGQGALVVTDPATVPEHPHLGSIGGGAPPGALFSSLGGPGGTSGGAASSARITQVSSGSRTMYSRPGILNTNPSTRLNAAPFGPYVGATSAKSPELFAVGGGIKNLVVSTRGTRSGRTALMFIHGGYAGEIRGATTTTGAQKERFSSTYGSVAYHGLASAPATLDVTRAGTATRRTVEVTLAHAGTADTLGLSAKTGDVTLSHSGPATTFTLKLSGTRPGGLPQAYTSGSLPIGRGQSVHVTGIRWGATATTITLVVGGRPVSLRNSAAGRFTGAITRLGVREISAHRTTLRVVTSLPRLSRNSRAFVVWIVHRGRTLVKTHRAALPVGKRSVTATWTARFRRGVKLTFTAVLVTVAVHGATQQGAQTNRSKVFVVP